jgi:hypothetical protein
LTTGRFESAVTAMESSLIISPPKKCYCTDADILKYEMGLALEEELILEPKPVGIWSRLSNWWRR